MNTSSTNQPTTGREQLEKEIEKKLQETMKEVGEKFGPLQEFYTKSANAIATFIEGDRQRAFEAGIRATIANINWEEKTLVVGSTDYESYLSSQGVSKQK
jgi:hypothetical protein